jgi:hypothetical protein
VAYRVGDLVRVIGIATEEPFKKIKVGTVAPVVQVWQNTEYPYQIQGHSECLHEQELESAK